MMMMTLSRSLLLPDPVDVGQRDAVVRCVILAVYRVAVAYAWAAYYAQDPYQG